MQEGKDAARSRADNTTYVRTGRPTEFTPAELRRIFRQMVIAEMDGGLLRYSRRRALLRYAEDIGIPAFDANLLIAEAQHRVRRREPIDFDPDLTWAPGSNSSGEWSPAARMGLAILAAVAIDLLVIAWMLR